jgi:5-methylcytosine-specific restriction endonuclease McrA
MIMAIGYTDETFASVVKESFSIRECLKKLGLRHTGGNYKTFYNKVSNLNLDTSHFTGQAYMAGKPNKWCKKRLLVDILKDGVEYKSHELKIRLIKEGMREHKCEVCGNTEWMGKKIPLELDHINGVHTDNRIENLRIVCPNCHAQTETYCSKNIKKEKMTNEQKKINDSKRKMKFVCVSCGGPCTKTKHGICKKCTIEKIKKITGV